MKSKVFKTKLILILCLIHNLISFGQNSLIVNNKNGTKFSFSINNTRKITFSSLNLVVSPITNDVVTFSINNIQYLNFKQDVISNTSEINVTLPIRIYPNPTVGNFTVESAEPISQINVLNLQGVKIIYVQPIVSSVQIQLGSYSNGTYLIQVFTSKGISVYKIIKN